MAVIHIPEEEAAKDLGSLMRRAAHGDEVVIDGKHTSVRLVPNNEPKGRTGAEILAILESLPGDRALMDDSFANDVRKLREGHPGSLDGSKWD